jgi:SAM-dependent methyltransferase
MSIMGEDEFNTLKRLTIANKFIPVPPNPRNFVGGDADDFIWHGLGQVELLWSKGLLQSHSVLELGCGIGRLALPLTQYLDNSGFYFGIDINLGGVAWCHENITQRYTNFHFAVVNARNENYGHPHEYGRKSFVSAEIPLPTGRTFDFIVAFSLFTHLLWDDVQRYFALISERLKPDGLLVSSWFLIDKEARKGIAEGSALFAFDISGTGPTHLIANSGYSNAIAHDEIGLMDLAASSGLAPESVNKFPWRQGEVGQDTLVWRKR